MAWRFDRDARESCLDEGELRNDAPDGTPERILPDDLPAAPDHVARYAFAAHWAAGSRVLDLCCGTGYGSNLLAAAGARLVVGVDIAEDAVKYASSQYGSAGVEFLCEDATNELTLSNFDLIVCFEGLEHINRPESLVRNAARMLAPGGTALISSPNSAYYPGGHSGNPYHVREFSRTEFEDLLRESFDSVEMYCQRESAGLSSRDRALVMRPMCADKSEDGTELGERPFVWLAICREAMCPS
jgi:2-polyprenyl-3-methyl-5-hydroxy-6-metoxy-1,4-benzoquinol methylase